MIDASHANSSKQHQRQIDVMRDVSAQLEAGNRCIFGVMVESHLQVGAQKFTPGKDDPARLAYGQSITHACIRWGETVNVLDILGASLPRILRRPVSIPRAGHGTRTSGMLDGSGLRLQGRLLGHADLEEAARLVPAWLPLPAAVRAAVPAVWTRLLGHPGFNADVIEDLNRPVGQRLMGLGVAIALDERWSRLLREDPPPFAPALLYAELHEGRFQPPGDKELARLNGRGEVSFLVLHYEQQLHDLANPDTLELLGVAMSLFRYAHAGYRLQGLYQEGLGEQGAYMLSMGFRARTARGQAGVPELYGLHRHEAALLLPGSPVRDAFQFTPPRFGFSASERRLLRLAVTQLTDEEIGAELGISGHGVKKLWRQVHQRAMDAMPHLFDASSTTAGGEGGGRGPEKRRALLQYLRQHPEELRPYSAAAATQAVARSADVAS